MYHQCGAKPIFILALFLSEAVLIGLFGATSGILTGIGMAYVLTDMSPHSSSGGGGGTTPASASPIFVPIDLLHVWALSLLLSLGAGIMPAWKASRLSPLEALRTVSSITKLSKYLYISETERMIQYITRLNKTSSMRQQGEATPIFGIP